MILMSYMDILKLKVVSEEARVEILDELSRELVIAEKGNNGVFRSGMTEDRESVKSEFNSILSFLKSKVSSVIQSNEYAKGRGEEIQSEVEVRGKSISLDSNEDDLKAIALELLIEGIREDIEKTRNAGIMQPISRNTGPKPNLTPPDKSKEQVEELINTTLKQSGSNSEFSYQALEEQINNLLDVESFLQYLEEGRSTVYRKKIEMVVESATEVFELFGSLLSSGSDIDDILKSIVEQLKQTEKNANYLLSEDKFKDHPYDGGILRESIKAFQDYLQSKVVSQTEYHTLSHKTLGLIRNIAEFVDSAWKHSIGKGPSSLDYNLLGDNVSEQKNNFSFLKVLARNDQEHMYRYAPRNKNIMLPLVAEKGKGKKYIKHSPALSKKQENQNKLYDKYLNLGVMIAKNLREFNTEEELTAKFLDDLESQGFRQRKVNNKAEYKFIHEKKDATFTSPNGRVYKVGSQIDAKEYTALLEEYVQIDSLLEYIANQYKRDEGRILDVKMDGKLKGQLSQLKRKIDSMLLSRMEEKPDLVMNDSETFRDIYGDLKKPKEE